MILAGIRIKTVTGKTGEVKGVTFNKVTLSNIHE
jgi:polygalacturonase